MAGTRRQKPTIIDVARQARVSPGTVSNALSGRRGVDPATKSRVEAAVQALGYSPNSQAQRLRGGRSGAIGLFLSLPLGQAAGPTRFGFAMEVAAIAASIAAEDEIALILAPPMHGHRAVPSFLDIDGALFIEPVAGNPLTATLRQRGVPIVTIGPEPDVPGQPFVDLHTDAAMTMLLHQLEADGCRRIALMTGTARNDLRRVALDRYRRFIEQRDAARLIFEVDETAGETGAYQAATDALRVDPAIDGILAPYDPFAIGCHRAAADLRTTQPVVIATRYNSIGVQQAGILAVDLHLPAVSTLAVNSLMHLIKKGSPSLDVSSRLPSLVSNVSVNSASPVPPRPA